MDENPTTTAAATPTDTRIGTATAACNWQARLHHGDKHYTTLLLRLLPLPLLILPLRVLLLFDCACLSRLESSRSPATDLVAVQCQKCVHFIVKLVVFCQFTCWITSIRGHQERVPTWATAMPSLSAGRANCSQCKRGIRPQRPDRARIKQNDKTRFRQRSVQTATSNYDVFLPRASDSLENIDSRICSCWCYRNVE